MTRKEFVEQAAMRVLHVGGNPQTSASAAKASAEALADELGFVVGDPTDHVILNLTQALEAAQARIAELEAELEAATAHKAKRAATPAKAVG